MPDHAVFLYDFHFEAKHIKKVFLLDQAIWMEKMGLTFTNLVDKIVPAVTELPYQTTTDVISQTCISTNQRIPDTN